MAKRYGVSEEVVERLLSGLQDLSGFTEEEQVALEFAKTMSVDSLGVTDELWNRLRKHFDEGEIVEIACVVGTFNYFNRFNNALGVDITT
ncbi:carboxymuconolactone decarboxylase family protein [Alkaliphilus hydrothermalis]|uniref:Alkylhydroperoxidase family enzyme n=1 Tax=Alkaliphilus hydrothermalis TaxID=1482730 RepID=A0ABS2NSH2_9FIRM|nr:carboxymuconolactone decarboxylase family protein [Alkaliphilus hydrothermalis]MBM7615903.1 alkylhydroperoxidase family enzyme [Alkaliphilus hydrothermalis]